MNEGRLRCITNQNDMYLYFEVIDRIEPNSILDIGMFLKRIGAISRQVMDKSINETVLLDGIDFMPDINIPVYSEIYNHYCSLQKWLDAFCVQKKIVFDLEYYDLAVMIHVEEYFEDIQKDMVWAWLSAHVRHVLTDCDSDARRKQLQSKGRFRDITIEEDRYGLITFR